MINDNLQTIIDRELDKLKKQRSEEMMTLGKFIKALEKCSRKATVTLEPFGAIPTCFDSYRGYYSDLALGYVFSEYSPDVEITVEQLLKMAKKCIGKTFTGWKGGDFVMDETTPLWISNLGKCSDIVIEEVKQISDNHVEIHCYKKEV